MGNQYPTEWNELFARCQTAVQQTFDFRFHTFRQDPQTIAARTMAANSSTLAGMGVPLFTTRLDQPELSVAVRTTLGLPATTVITTADGFEETVATPPNLDLFDLFLANIADEEFRQFSTCGTCREFFHHYGHLVFVDPATGALVSALWDETRVPEIYHEAVRAVRRFVERQEIVTTVVPAAGNNTFGIPLTSTQHHNPLPEVLQNALVEGGLSAKVSVTTECHDHFHLILPVGLSNTAKRREQITQQNPTAAGKVWANHESFKLTMAALLADPSLIDRAVVLVEEEQLYRSDTYAPILTWLKRWVKQIAQNKSPRFCSNLVWLACAMAPHDSFVMVRGGMVGQLFELLATQSDIELVISTFNGLAGHVNYRQPQRPASQEQIGQTTAFFAEQGLNGALQRRLATLADLKAVWSPAVKDEPAPPVATADNPFAALAPKKPRLSDQPRSGGVEGLSLPDQRMSWTKFVNQVLPRAAKIELMFEHAQAIYPLAVHFTASDPEAPPLFDYDRPEARNPVSRIQYVISNEQQGLRPDLVGLAAGRYYEVSAITQTPPLWHGEDERLVAKYGRYPTLIIKEARLAIEVSGVGLLPQLLRGDLRPHERVIAQYNNLQKPGLEAQKAADSVGLIIGDVDYTGLVKLRVTREDGAKANIYICTFE